MKGTFGFNTTKTTPTSPELKQSLSLFEKKFRDLIGNIKLRNKSNNFQQKLNEDIRNIKQEPKLLIAADKTSNYYKTDSRSNASILKRNIEKEYKKSSTRYC